MSASEPCPALKRDESVEALVAEKAEKDEAKVAELAASGVKPVRLVYADGGQNPVFTGYKDRSDPDALATPPQEIVLNDRAKPAPAVVKIAVADAEKKRAASVAPAPVEAAAAQSAPVTVAAIPAPANQSGGMLGGLTGGAKNVQKWLHLGGQDSAPAPVEALAPDPDQSILADAPLPPRRDDVHLASLHTPPTPANAAEPRRVSGRRARFVEYGARVCDAAGAIAAGHLTRRPRRVSPIRPETRERRRAASWASASTRVGMTIGAPARGHT